MKKMLFGVSIFIIILIAIGIGSLYMRKHVAYENPFISGTTETRHIDVSSKIPGRIDSLCVDEGDYVVKGQLLAVLESKEILAKVEQARGAMDATQAKLQMANNGVRPQELDAAMKQYNQAKAQFDLMEKTFTRVSRLFSDSVISSQEKDQAEAQYINAREQMNAAKSKYEMAKEGARTEEKDAARSLFYQAKNVFSEVNIYADERNILCPVNGEVEKIIADPGEMLSAGYPVITVIDTSEIWVVLQIKETLMSSFKKGTELKGRIPALDNEEYQFFVSYIAPMADFATWRPTNQKGEFDIRTFEIHCKPKSPVNGLRAGMTVNILSANN